MCLHYTAAAAAAAPVRTPCLYPATSSLATILFLPQLQLPGVCRSGQHIAMADQAGSGKTLAYLLPVIQQMRLEEAQLGKPATQPRSPRALVLAPTTELVQQVEPWRCIYPSSSAIAACCAVFIAHQAHWLPATLS